MDDHDADDVSAALPRTGQPFRGHARALRRPSAAQARNRAARVRPLQRLAEGTRTQQPALFLCSMAQWASRRPRDRPLAAAGHSLGEYAALTAAGAIDFEDGVRLVRARAQAMADAAALQPGGMVAMLGGERDDVYELAADLELSLANDNAPGQIVLSGAMRGVDAAVRAPPTSAAARASSTSRAPSTPRSWRPPPTRCAQALDATPIQEPVFPVLSNGSTRPFEDIRAELAENLLKPVRWREILLELQAMGATDYTECGPGSVLRGLVKRTLRAARRDEGRRDRDRLGAARADRHEQAVRVLPRHDRRVDLRRTGIRERRHLNGTRDATDLALEACDAALAGRRPRGGRHRPRHRRDVHARPAHARPRARGRQAAGHKRRRRDRRQRRLRGLSLRPRPDRRADRVRPREARARRRRRGAQPRHRPQRPRHRDPLRRRRRRGRRRGRRVRVRLLAVRARLRRRARRPALRRPRRAAAADGGPGGLPPRRRAHGRGDAEALRARRT